MFEEKIKTPEITGRLKQNNSHSPLPVGEGLGVRGNRTNNPQNAHRRCALRVEIISISRAGLRPALFLFCLIQSTPMFQNYTQWHTLISTAVIVIILSSCSFLRQDAPHITQEEPPTTQTDNSEDVDSSQGIVKVFLVRYQCNDGSCGERIMGRTGKSWGGHCYDSLVPIDRHVPQVRPHMREALEALFSLPVHHQKDGDPTPCFDSEDCYEGNGLYNALYRSVLSIETIELNNGHANVRLSGEAVTGGVCDTPRYLDQIYETILQFPDVNDASVWFNDIPIEQAFSER